MSSFQRLLASHASTAAAVPACGKQPAAVIRGQRMALLCLPATLLGLWLAMIAAGDGYVDALGNPIGGDFAMFYVAGEMAARGEWNALYDESLQQERLLQLIPSLPSNTYLPYRYPPLVALVAAPLAVLPYVPAFMLFSGLSLAMWVGMIGLFVRVCMRRLRATAATAVLAIGAAPVAVQTLIDGQASLFWFAIAMGCWICLQRERYEAAGCLLALAACKPNVMLLLAVVLCLRYPRMLVGLVPTGAIMLAITLAVAGPDSLRAYVNLGRQLAWEPWRVETPYWKVQSLLAWTEPMLGAAARRINMLAGLATAAVIAFWWRRGQPSPGRDAVGLCAALVVNALFNPYTPVYDLTLLCLGLLACCAHADARDRLPEWLERRDVQCTAALVLLGPILSQGLAKLAECPLQFMPAGLAAASFYWLWRLRSRVAATIECAVT